MAPPELEGVLLSHPRINDAAVIGVKSSNGDDELPRGYVVRKPGEGDGLSVDEIHEYMAQRLSGYKRLTGGLVFLESIPKTPSGKILKRVLREQAVGEMKRERGPKL